MFRGQPFVVDAGQPVGVDVALEDLDVVDRVRQHHHAARRIHDVVVQFLRQRFPELDRVFVDRLALLPEIVGADDRGVAPGVAAAEPALLDHGDVPHPVFAGEIIGGGQPMAAGAQDDGVIGRLGIRRAPLRGPVGVPAQRLPGEREERKFHGRECDPRGAPRQASARRQDDPRRRRSARFEHQHAGIPAARGGEVEGVGRVADGFGAEEILARRRVDDEEAERPLGGHR